MHSDKVIKDCHKRVNKDYKALSKKDKGIIDNIDALLEKLSEKGRDYWQTYYN
jgi:hypothetical protein